ncbi:acyltransferase [Miniphocaeibacter massiliensis]|uniref:acyltransferase n=1 Tax=Miniphocaeibacter massiliensis TaxID=2041841 RepID=UPI001F5E0DC4|nr:acyltransferase family protein [Miniphocaeibacter massiliensis]
MINNIQKKRDLNLDLVKCVAVFFVLCVHFFLKIKFYTIPIKGVPMYIMVTLRTIFIVCVPLFIISTGYLMSKKQLNRKYYSGIFNILFIYVFASLICISYKIHILNESFNFGKIIKQILNYSASPYAWYVEMYISLFLLIPFLNILYNNLKNKKHKICLIITLFVIVSLPSLLNAYSIKIIPDWWKNIWPLLYYFIGCYIREYQVKIKLKLSFLIYFLILIISSLYNIIINYEIPFPSLSYNGFYGWQPVFSSIILFVILKNINLKNIPKLLKSFITKVSSLSLGIYLTSWIGDNLIYTILNKEVPLITDRLYYFPIIIISVFTLSMIISWIITSISSFLAKYLTLLLTKYTN